MIGRHNSQFRYDVHKLKNTSINQPFPRDPIPSASGTSGFGVGFGYLNTEPNRVFGALGILPLVILCGLFGMVNSRDPNLKGWNRDLHDFIT